MTATDARVPAAHASSVACPAERPLVAAHRFASVRATTWASIAICFLDMIKSFLSRRGKTPVSAPCIHRSRANTQVATAVGWFASYRGVGREYSARPAPGLASTLPCMAVEPRALQRDDLLRAADSAGFSVSGRLLEDFRRDGLVPRPVRIGNDGRRPVWAYPPGSDRQLVQLLRWREHTKNVDVLRVVLWIEGFPVSLEAVRTSVIAVVDELLGDVNQELRAEAARQGLDPDAEPGAVVAALASTLAARRGRNALPRPIRVRADQRAAAVVNLLEIFVLGQRPDMTEEQAEAVEKVLGVSPGRRQRVEGAAPWLIGPASDLAGAADFVSLPRMAEALAGATGSEWETARSMAAALFLQLPLMVRAATVMYGKTNFVGMGGVAGFDSEPLAGVLLFAFTLGAIRAGWDENLKEVSDSLARWPSLIDEMRKVLDMPQSELSRNLAGHSPETLARTQRIIEALQDGELDAGPRRTH